MIYSRLFRVLKRFASSTTADNLLSNSNVQQYLQLLSNRIPSNTSDKVKQLVEVRRKIEEDMKALKDLSDPSSEMKQLIDEERKNYLDGIQELNNKIILELLPRADNGVDVTLEVTAGVGGKEAMLFAQELFEMYLKYSSYKKWLWQLYEEDIPEGGGLRHGSALISGRTVGSLIYEAGVHRVQRVPATEKSGRVHTSTVTVAILPQPSDVEIVIKETDLKIETKTSRGPGGQHVNKTETCVRITHIPTGLVVENQTDRSQIKNKQLAIQRLRSKLHQMEADSVQSETHLSRKKQIGAKQRSEKIRTYNYNQDRVTDHRVGITLRNLSGFLEGGPLLDQLIANIEEYEQQQQLLTTIQETLESLK